METFEGKTKMEGLAHFKILQTYRRKSHISLANSYISLAKSDAKKETIEGKKLSIYGALREGSHKSKYKLYFYP